MNTSPESWSIEQWRESTQKWPELASFMVRTLETKTTEERLRIAKNTEELKKNPKFSDEFWENYFDLLVFLCQPNNEQVLLTVLLALNS